MPAGRPRSKTPLKSKAQARGQRPCFIELDTYDRVAASARRRGKTIRGEVNSILQRALDRGEIE